MTTRILIGDVRAKLAELPDESVHCVVTSLPESVLAYAAGVIDSDGSIGIRRSTYAMRVSGEASQPVYATRICVKQVTPEAVALLKETFGGSLMLQKPSAAKGRPLYYWEIHSRQAVACLHLIAPFLRIKLLQAANCIALASLIEKSKAQRVAHGRGHAGAARRDPVLSAEMQQLYEHAKHLNRVGVRP